jgi:hypothetical protein
MPHTSSVTTPCARRRRREAHLSRTARTFKERNFRNVELASGVVEKVHADFGDSSGPLHGGVGAVAVAFGRAVIAIEFGGWFLRLVSWLRAGKKRRF